MATVRAAAKKWAAQRGDGAPSAPANNCERSSPPKYRTICFSASPWRGSALQTRCSIPVRMRGGARAAQVKQLR